MTTEVVGNCGWTYAPVSEHSHEVIEGRLRTFAYDGPIEWESFADHLGVLSRIGHSQNLAWFVGHNTIRCAAGVTGAQATEQELERMEGYVAEAMHAGALGLSTGLEFKPGREAPTDEIVRLNKVVGRYGGHYTSHMRNRDSSLQDSTEEFLRIIREGGTKGEISHFNVRNRTGAAPGAWQRAVDTMQAAREVEGLDVLADTTPFRDGLGAMVGILPPWILAEGWEEACKRLRDPVVRERLPHECDRYWRFIHRGEWDRVRLQASPQYPGLEGKSFPEISRLLGKSEWECYFDILAASGPAMDSILLIGELFTDEHLAEMISHPLFSLGVDGYTSALDVGLDAISAHPVCFAGHVHYLTHHVRELRARPLSDPPRPRAGHAAARGDDPEDDEHAGGALRPGRPGTPRARACGRRGRARLRSARRRLDAARSAQYVVGVDEVLVNGTSVVSAGEHTGARPGRHLPRP